MKRHFFAFFIFPGDIVMEKFRAIIADVQMIDKRQGIL